MTPDRIGWSTPLSDHFFPGRETRYPLCRRLGGHQACLHRIGRSRPHLESIARPSKPYRVAILAELSRPIRHILDIMLYDSANKLLLLLLKVILPMHVIACIEYLSTTIENHERCCSIWGSNSNGVDKSCFPECYTVSRNYLTSPLRKQ